MQQNIVQTGDLEFVLRTGTVVVCSFHRDLRLRRKGRADEVPRLATSFDRDEPELDKFESFGDGQIKWNRDIQKLAELRRQRP